MLEFKGVQIASLFDIYQSIVRPLLQMLRGRAPSLPPETAGGKDDNLKGPETVAENKRAADEALELHTLLKGMRIDADGTPATWYQPKPEEFWIFPAIVVRLKPGARKKALDILATKLVDKDYERIAGYTVHGPDSKGKSRADTPDMERWRDKDNIQGVEIINGLTWFAIQAQASMVITLDPGMTREMKGVEFVVKFLERTRLYDNVEDTLAAGKESIQEVWNKLMKALGGYDTGLHMLFARIVVSKNDLRQLFADGTPGDEQLRSIEAELDSARKREKQEALQRYLVNIGKDAQAVRKAADRAANRRFIKGFIWFIIVGGLLTAFLPKIFG